MWMGCGELTMPEAKEKGKRRSVDAMRYDSQAKETQPPIER
jgi:hypothetical protein